MFTLHCLQHCLMKAPIPMLRVVGQSYYSGFIKRRETGIYPCYFEYFPRQLFIKSRLFFNKRPANPLATLQKYPPAQKHNETLLLPGGICVILIPFYQKVIHCLGWFSLIDLLLKQLKSKFIIWLYWMAE